MIPCLLNEIPDPPKELFIKGELLEDEKYIAVVGTRKASSYGKKIATQIARDLAGLGITVVSGLAIGIDTYAHEAALQAGGRTVAVLGCGLDQIYPPQNSNLAKRIIRNGALISEFPEGTEPARYNFPHRNRIISGLSLATIVVEAGEKSGALITARKAMDQGREVFAVPGDITRPQSKGALLLLKEGAHPFTDTKDVLENLKLQSDIISHIKQHKMQSLTSEEKEVFEHILHGEEVANENIIRKSSLHISKIQSVLTLLELRGLIERTKTGMYVRL
ncbi:DNA-processing protein DprA [Patescibacteria group bacterium]|nr:DNA-processing protein DprA [Patescibacteria group bacterium]